MKKFLNYNYLIRFGLGVIFIANALTAIFAPNEFIELIKNSFVSTLLPMRPEIFVWAVIGLNDLIVGLLLISGFATRRVALWAIVWLIGVIAVVGDLFGTIEHLGLLLIALALAVGDRHLT